MKKKKELSQKLNRSVKAMIFHIRRNVVVKRNAPQKQMDEQLAIYQHMLNQIKIWLTTGHHPKDKILSLWEMAARAISKGKSRKSAEFGSRWLIIRQLPWVWFYQRKLRMP